MNYITMRYRSGILILLKTLHTCLSIIRILYRTFSPVFVFRREFIAGSGLGLHRWNVLQTESTLLTQAYIQIPAQYGPIDPIAESSDEVRLLKFTFTSGKSQVGILVFEVLVLKLYVRGC